MDKQRVEKLAETWREFIARQKEGGFRLNKDAKKVLLLAEGALNNEETHGFKYCPCRMARGDKEADAKLICPCNFRSQKVWKEKGECWCSLFVKY